jgi:hypothetical protein
MATSRNKPLPNTLPFDFPYGLSDRIWSYGGPAFIFGGWAWIGAICALWGDPSVSPTHAFVKYVVGPLAFIVFGNFSLSALCNLFATRPHLRLTETGIEYRDLYVDAKLPWSQILAHTATLGAVFNIPTYEIIAHGNPQHPAFLIIDTTGADTYALHSAVLQHTPRSRHKIFSAFGNNSSFVWKQRRFMRWWMRGGRRLTL